LHPTEGKMEVQIGLILHKRKKDNVTPCFLKYAETESQRESTTYIRKEKLLSLK